MANVLRIFEVHFINENYIGHILHYATQNQLSINVWQQNMIYYINQKLIMNWKYIFES